MQSREDGGVDRSPLGSETQWYWDRRTEYFDRFDDGIQTDAEGLYSVVPREIGMRQASQFRSLDVVDAFAGIGGNAIAFALSGKAVVAIELDPSRFQMAVNNAEIYGVSRSIDFVEGDCREHLVLLAGDRALYLDPPWGGRSYLRNHKFLLEHFSPDGHELLDCRRRLKTRP